MTRAPSRASPLAMANPIPLVEPETRAVLSASFRFMDRTLRSLEWRRDLVGAAPAKRRCGFLPPRRQVPGRSVCHNGPAETGRRPMTVTEARPGHEDEVRSPRDQ